MVKKYLGFIYLILASSIWGGVYVVSKVVLAVIPPLELVWLRYIVALISLGFACLVTRQSWRIERQDIPRIFLIGLIGYFISIWAQFAGTQLSSAHMGAVITSATPAFMVLFARILLKEKITLRKGFSVFWATVGVLLIAGVDQLGDSSQVGGLILGGAALTWALMSVMVKQIPSHYSQLIVTTYAILAATIAMTPLILPAITASELNAVISQPLLWGSLLYLGIVSTAGAFYFWNKGLQLLDAAQAGLFFFFQPLVGTALGWAFLGEQVGLAFWVGTLFIVSGVLLIVRE